MNTTINFQVSGVPHRFDVTHNLTDRGLSIDAAFHNWVYRVSDGNYTVESFCKYVKSKDSTIECKPEKL